MAKTPTFNESVPVINDNNIRKFAIILAQKSQQAIHIRVGLFEGSLKWLISSIFQLPRYHEAIVVQEEKKVKTGNQIPNFLIMTHTRKDNHSKLVQLNNIVLAFSWKWTFI